MRFDVIKMLNRGRRTSHPVFYGTSSDGWKSLTFVTALLAAGTVTYRLTTAWTSLTAATALLWLMLAVAAVAVPRIIRRCVWVFDDGRVIVRGFWCTARTSVANVAAVSYVPSGAKEGHRVYITYSVGPAGPRAQCFSSSLRAAPALAVALELLNILATQSGRQRLDLTEQYLEPAGALTVRRDWRGRMLSRFGTEL